MLASPEDSPNLVSAIINYCHYLSFVCRPGYMPLDLWFIPHSSTNNSEKMHVHLSTQVLKQAIDSH